MEYKRIPEIVEAILWDGKNKTFEVIKIINPNIVWVTSLGFLVDKNTVINVGQYIVKYKSYFWAEDKEDFEKHYYPYYIEEQLYKCPKCGWLGETVQAVSDFELNILPDEGNPHCPKCNTIVKEIELV